MRALEALRSSCKQRTGMGASEPKMLAAPERIPFVSIEKT